MEEGGGGEREVFFLLQLGRLLGGHTKTVGVLGQGTPRLGGGVRVHSIPTQDQFGA